MLDHDARPGSGVGVRPSSDPTGRLVDRGGDPELLQEVGGADPGGSPADDHDTGLTRRRPGASLGEDLRRAERRQRGRTDTRRGRATQELAPGQPAGRKAELEIVEIVSLATSREPLETLSLADPVERLIERGSGGLGQG